MTAEYTWSGQVPTPLNGAGKSVYCGAYSPELDLYVFGGHSSDDSCTIVTTPGPSYLSRGEIIDLSCVFTSQGNPWGAGGTCITLTWVSTLGLFIATGENSAGTESIFTSPDGVTWTSRGVPNGANHYSSQGAYWSESQSLLVVGGEGPASGDASGLVSICSSTDGITYTQIPSPPDYASAINPEWVSVVYSDFLGLWIFVGAANTAPNQTTIMTSPDLSTFTLQSCPWDNGSASVTDIISDEIHSLLFVTVNGSPTKFASSPDGVTWTPLFTDATFVTNGATGLAQTNDSIVFGGAPGTITSSFTSYYSTPDQGSTITPEIQPFLGSGSTGSHKVFYDSPNRIPIICGGFGGLGANILMGWKLTPSAPTMRNIVKLT